MMKKAGKKSVGLKIISVVLAVLLWFYVVNQGETSNGKNAVEVELKYHNLGQDLNIQGPERVTVRIWGAAQKTNKIIAYLDLAGLSEGVYELPVQVEPVPGAMFTRVNPNKVQVTITRLKEKILPAGCRVIQKPMEGYEMVDMVIVPDKCLVKGEESQVQKVASVMGEANLGDIKDISSFKTRLLPRDIGGRIVKGVTVIPEDVTVYAVVKEKVNSKEVPVKLLTTGRVAEGYALEKLTVQPQNCTILGNEIKLSEIQDISTAPLDISGKAESFRQEVLLQIPEGVKVYPAKVSVEAIIQKTPEQEGNNEG